MWYPATSQQRGQWVNTSPSKRGFPVGQEDTLWMLSLHRELQMTISEAMLRRPVCLLSGFLLPSPSRCLPQVSLVPGGC